MSEENYKLFKEFFDRTVEEATDQDMNVIFGALTVAFKTMKYVFTRQEPSKDKKDDYKA